jgi:hypothetical protein
LVGGGGCGVPDDVEDDAGIGGVTVVAMGVPRGGEQIDFDVAGEREIVIELDEGVVEIGAGFVVPEAGVEDADVATVEGIEGIAEETLVLPEGLEEALCGNAIRRIVEGDGIEQPCAPLGVELRLEDGHLVIAFGKRARQSQASIRGIEDWEFENGSRDLNVVRDGMSRGV